MGVADNKSYKDQYHFRDRYFKNNPDEVPSLNVGEQINHTIKENPEKSNVEVEKDEIILNPDLSALFKAIGKTHKKGGIDVQLKPNSFVFSDDKSLAFTERDIERFEFKLGGKYKKTQTTPAKVVKKLVKPKDYNRLINNLNDPNTDELAKKSSGLMLEKYIETLGNIAFLQEAKKGLPDGIPHFSVGTAPIYNADLKDEIDSQKQYMKKGGNVKAQLGFANFMSSSQQKRKPKGYYDSNGMWIGTDIDIATGDNQFNELLAASQALTGNSPTGQIPRPGSPTGTSKEPPMNWGLWKGDRLKHFENRFGVSNAADKLGNLDEVANRLGYTGPKSNKAFQRWLYDSSPENRAIIDKWHQKYEDPSITAPLSARNKFDDKIGIRWQEAMLEMLNRIPQPEGGIPTPVSVTETTTLPPTQVPAPVPGEVTPNPQGWKRADWKFTPWQRISQGYNLAKLASVEREMPYRSHLTPTYGEPLLVNPEQTLGNLRAGYNTTLRSGRGVNPILQGAMGQQAFGQFLNQVPQVESQYDNQNVGIRNQFQAGNLQTRNAALAQNMQNDQQYWREAAIGRQNFRNMRSFLGDQYMNNVLRDVETNQSLAYNLLTQNRPAYGYDWDTGHLTRNQKDIRDAMAGNVQGDNLEAFINQVNQSSMDEKDKYNILARIFGAKHLAQNLGSKNLFGPGPFKKGGKVKRNPYK